MSFADVAATVYPIALLAFWVAGWLLVRRGARLESVPARRVLLVAHGVVGAFPLAWLVAVAALVARAYARIGAWPHGFEIRPSSSTGWIDCVDANIDARSFGWHSTLVFALGTAVLWTWLVFPSLHSVALRRGTQRKWIGRAVLVAGFSVWLCMFLDADPAGVMEWLDG